MPANHTSTAAPLVFPLPDLELVKVAAGDFIMGDDDSEYDDEKPAHPVHLQHPFYIGKCQVTQRLYEKVMEEKHPSLKLPSDFKGARRPVENVSWEDTKLFFTALEEIEEIKDFKKAQGLADYVFRLPSEAEWECAARRGIHGQGYAYCGSDDLKQVGWYRDNSGDETKPVGLLLPNELGLHDMSGNVWEWCEDDWHGDYKSDSRPDDGRAWVDSPQAANRVRRGGCYFSGPIRCRPSLRSSSHLGNRNFGFRMVLSLQSVGSHTAIP